MRYHTPTEPPHGPGQGEWWPGVNPAGGEAWGPRVIQGEVWSRDPYPPHPRAPDHAGIPRQRDRRTREGGSYGGQGRPSRPRPGRRRRRRLTRAVILLFSVLLLTPLGTYVWAETKLDREVDLSRLEDRPPPGRGTNYLIVGSDSREGLSGEARKYLHTGGSADEGRRTDSMILLHTGAHGTTMVSLPRDSWVTIPSYIRPDTGKHYPASKNKLNAAFSLGGPDLLIRTVESNTGLRVDRYAEIGFAGFVGVVDAVGGVRMCLDKDVKDKKSGENLTKGCHLLDGRAALSFVRQRHQEAQGDLGRTQNQQKFLSALAHKVATPGTLLNPDRIYPTVNAGLNTLVVDKQMTLWDMASMFQSIRKVSADNGEQIHVPVSDLGFRTSKGSAVKWDVPQAEKLFAELRNDQPISLEAKG
jgi:LCP family protein required for cell wall assembly